MPPHPAISSFVQQPQDAVNASALSTVVTALQDLSTATDLIQQQRPTCLEVLRRLLFVANDESKSTDTRLLALEGFFYLSQPEDQVFRESDLFASVQQLNSAFDALLEQNAELLQSPREMITVLLLRCTGYHRVKANDLLVQLCGGDEACLVALLVTIVRRPQAEWPLLQAVLRCFYELTTPAAYFSAAAAGETMTTTDVSAFQARLARYVQLIVAQQVVHHVTAVLTARWGATAAVDSSAGLGELAVPSSAVSTQATAVTAAQRAELLQWSIALRSFAAWIENIAEFSDPSPTVAALQQSFLQDHNGFLTTVLLGFVVAAMQIASASSAPSLSVEDDAKDPYKVALLAVLRLLRYAVYKPAVRVASLSYACLAAWDVLARQVAALEPTLRAHITGVLLMVLVVECLCNLNAAAVQAPVSLATSFDHLLNTIAADEAVLQPAAGCSTSQAFAIAFMEEDSSYVVSNNASSSLVHARFATQEKALREDAVAAQVMEMLQSQLNALQAVVLQLAFSQLLSGFDTADEADELRHPLLPPGGPGRPSAGAPSASSAAANTTRRGSKPKRGHPPEFCCQLTKKLMREPVTLANGHHFEYDALAKVVEEFGHVDPLSGEAIAEEIELDHDLQQRIARYRVTRAAGKEAPA